MNNKIAAVALVSIGFAASHSLAYGAEGVPDDATMDVAATAASKGDAPRISTNRLVEEVIVTAQKREERLQDVPISIQAFSQEKLEALGIESVQDVQRATPGFTVTNSAGFNVVFMRGVGSDAFLPCVDSSVPFYIDGVPLLATQGTSDTLGRISRVEVLKGPQGTLFGRNATGGAVNVVTPDPDDVFAGDVKLDIGNRNQRSIVAYANIPLTNSFAFNLSAFSNSRDNIITNDYNGFAPDVFSRGARVKLGWTPFDTVSVLAFANYQNARGNANVDFQLVRPAPVLSPVLGAGDPKFDRHLTLDGAFGIETVSRVAGATVSWNPGPVDVKLIYANQLVDAIAVTADFDGTTRPVANAVAGNGFGAREYVKQDSAELQFVSNADSPFADYLQLTAGLFYLSSKGGMDPVAFVLAPDVVSVLLPAASPAAQGINSILSLAGLPAIANGVALKSYGALKSESYSAYLQGTYHLTPTIDFTAGGRYQSEQRDLVNSRTTFYVDQDTEITLPFPQGDLPTLKPKQTSLRTALQWRPFDDNGQIYASWARGYKNPLYNTVNLTGNLFGTMVEVKAERVDTAELGLKSRLFDGAAQFNVAGFYTVQKNPLSSNISIPSGGVANFTNAEEAIIKGFDGDFLVLPMPDSNSGLAVTGSFSYIDATYSSFLNGQGYDDLTGLGFGGGGARLPARDLSGKRIPRVPRWSYQLGVNQRLDFAGGNSVEIGVDTSWASKIYFLPQNSEFSTRSPTQLINAHVTYIYAPAALEITAYINNITDKLYADSAFVSDFGTALLANENVRFFGLRTKLSF